MQLSVRMGLGILTFPATDLYELGLDKKCFHWQRAELDTHFFVDWHS